MPGSKTTNYEEITKRHLLYARLSLELLAKQQADTLYAPALSSAAILQLNWAYAAFIDELQARLNVTPRPSRDLIEIIRYLQTRDIHSAELGRLAALEQDETSWLFSMRSSLSTSPGDKTLTANGANIIGSSAAQADQTENRPLVWLEKMEELCRQTREMMTEY